MRTLAVRLALALIVATLFVLPAAPAAAAPPPPGYPTNKIKTTALNRTLGPIPIRQGFWDAESNRGFGFDKVDHKHNLYTVSAVKRIMASPTIVKQSNGNYRLTLYAGRYRCSRLTCTLVDTRTVYGIHNGASFDRFHGQQVRGLLGMQTAYCRNPDGAFKCPNWVTPAIDRPGAPTASLRRTTTSDETTAGQAPRASSDRRLLADLEEGRTRLVSSPHRLPTTIPVPR